MILVIDNYDSFTYNLVQYIGELGAEVTVKRNDRITVDEAAAMKPSGIVISPGPGTPEDAGISVDLIRSLGASTPILGICLGHQCIGAAFGGKVVRGSRPFHGKASKIQHDGRGIFRGIDQGIKVGRYHSLVIGEELPSVLEVTARSEDGAIMGVRHKTYPIEGLQFHPESILTERGMEMVRNFLDMTAVTVDRSRSA